MFRLISTDILVVIFIFLFYFILSGYLRILFTRYVYLLWTPKVLLIVQLYSPKMLLIVQLHPNYLNGKCNKEKTICVCICPESLKTGYIPTYEFLWAIETFECFEKTAAFTDHCLASTGKGTKTAGENGEFER
uniref:Uncharacterized protein n=1 Tax=Onchocerca volvulus TaxID=6282 RepID=A0A8R1XZ69_ONCVO